MQPTMEKQYDPKSCEQQLYQAWQQAGAFHAEVDTTRPPYTIVIPPPNITGKLHMGHALDNTMQDILIRHKRMQGYNALWMPGTDHASIATEVKIVEALAAEGKTKADLGREGFLQRAWQWKEQYGGRIVEQLKRLGSSCDWDRLRFTMDEGCSKAVTEVFVRLYEKGLLYRGNRIINWCCDCHTAISDAEVEYEAEDGHLWHIAYPLEDGSGQIVVATTRPETMLGDTAVAVHPEDERYADLVGKQLVLPLTGRTIPIIADAYVEKDFGSGAVKITPAHDPNDYEVGQRHGLPTIVVMDGDGKMTAEAGPQFAGMDRYACREAIVRALQECGALVRIEDYNHNVGHCYRCGTVVEPRLSLQWFMKMQPLAEPALQAVRDGRIKFTPARFDRTYFNWMENIRDWCVSRQLWWGHRIPAWYCSCGHTVVAHSAPEACPECGGQMHQDEDVLDTWFSSALWPFSTLGWPENTPELQHFYPTSTLVTGYDIIFFWVARMIFSALEHTGEIPFKDVVIHGLVRDEQGRKMSKSLGNGIDPLEVIDKYGADALRYALIAGNAPGNDMRFYWQKVESARNFCNKLWNATRFVLNSAGDTRPSYDPQQLTLPQQWILQRYKSTVQAVTSALDSFDLGVGLTAVYDFLWDDFCDWAIELSKPVLYGEDPQAKQTQVAVLLEVLEGTLALLHPFMPFITEKLYSYLPGAEGFLMLKAWPTTDHIADYSAQAEAMQQVMEVVRSIRNLRAQLNVAPQKTAAATLIAAPEAAKGLAEGMPFALRLAGLSGVQFADEVDRNGMAVAISPAAQAFLPLTDLVDIEAEKARLHKELQKARDEQARIEVRLANPQFVARAKPEVVQADRDKLARTLSVQEAIQEQLAFFEQAN